MGLESHDACIQSDLFHFFGFLLVSFLCHNFSGSFEAFTQSAFKEPLYKDCIPIINILQFAFIKLF